MSGIPRARTRGLEFVKDLGWPSGAECPWNRSTDERLPIIRFMVSEVPFAYKLLGNAKLIAFDTLPAFSSASIASMRERSSVRENASKSEISTEPSSVQRGWV